jgi:hypothetical protein
MLSKQPPSEGAHDGQPVWPKRRPVKLQFHYVKTPGYRETACHGAVGGVTAQRKIWMALFSERSPIPRVVEFDVEAPEGAKAVEFNEATSKPTRVEGRQGIVRQVEFCTYMDLDTATRLQEWLGQRIAELQRMTEGKEVKVGKVE